MICLINHDFRLRSRCEVVIIYSEYCASWFGIPNPIVSRFPNSKKPQEGVNPYFWCLKQSYLSHVLFKQQDLFVTNQVVLISDIWLIMALSQHLLIFSMIFLNIAIHCWKTDQVNWWSKLSAPILRWMVNIKHRLTYEKIWGVPKHVKWGYPNS